MKSDGNFRIITIRKSDWRMFDWLMEEYDYPYWEMIDDVEECDPPHLFNKGFGNLLRFSYWDMISRERDLANDNRPLLPVLPDIDLRGDFRNSATQGDL